MQEPQELVPKMQIFRVTFLLIIIQQTFCETTIPCNRKVNVQPGLYCWNIAKDNNISVDQLRSFNPGLDCDALQIGQVICVSQAKKSSAPPTNSVQLSKGESCRLATIKSGETCWSISSQNGITINELQELNPPGINCDALQVGQEVCVGIYVELTSRGYSVLRV